MIVIKHRRTGETIHTDGADELCPAHRRAEDRHYQLLAMAEDNVDPLVPYPHLTDRY